MMFQGSTLICVCRGFWTGEASEKFIFTFDPNCRLVNIIAFNIRNPLVAGSVVARLKAISQILRIRRESQIYDTVVAPVSVYVIDMTVGPFAIMQKPCNAVLQVLFAIKPNLPIAVAAVTAGASPKGSRHRIINEIVILLHLKPCE